MGQIIGEIAIFFIHPKVGMNARFIPFQITFIVSSNDFIRKRDIEHAHLIKIGSDSTPHIQTGKGFAISIGVHTDVKTTSIGFGNATDYFCIQVQRFHIGVNGGEIVCIYLSAIDVNLWRSSPFKNKR